MSDRLQELQRQRALQQEHLAWLDREIARELAGGGGTPTLPVVPAPAAVPAGAGATGESTGQTAAALPLGPAAEKAGAMAHDARRGCLVAFVVGMTAFFVVVIGAYLIYLRLR